MMWQHFEISAQTFVCARIRPEGNLKENTKTNNIPTENKCSLNTQKKPLQYTNSTFFFNVLILLYSLF